MKANKRQRQEAKQLFRVCLVDGLLDENRARNAIRKIVATKPRGYLGVLSHFLRLTKLNNAQHSAQVESAARLSTEMHDGVKQSLVREYGPALNVSFAENQGLIGGMRIQVGSDVYDGSVRGRLAALERSF